MKKFKKAKSEDSGNDSDCIVLGSDDEGSGPSSNEAATEEAAGKLALDSLEGEMMNRVFSCSSPYQRRFQRPRFRRTSFGQRWARGIGTGYIPAAASYQRHKTSSGKRRRWLGRDTAAPRSFGRWVPGCTLDKDMYIR